MNKTEIIKNLGSYVSRLIFPKEAPAPCCKNPKIVIKDYRIENVTWLKKPFRLKTCMNCGKSDRPTLIDKS